MEMKENRRKTKEIFVGDIGLGGNYPIRIQSMLNVPVCQKEQAFRQIDQLREVGCEIIRISVPDQESLEAIGEVIKQRPNIPFVADIHFDYRLAVGCAERGIHKIRINPGNIGSEERIQAVVKACKAHAVPIRIGVNSGSLEKNILEKYGGVCAEALAESALYHASFLEKYDFDRIVLSVKASSVKEMIAANRLVASKCSYPLHLGVTEAGTLKSGIVKSAVGIGTLLADGIGDTIRVSLTANPEEEIDAAKEILKSLSLLSESSIDIVACPTCGRTKIDIITIASAIEKRVKHLKCRKNIKVAVMGCIVNGIGESGDADIGIAGGNGEAVLISHGKILKKISEENIVDVLVEEIQKLC